MRDLIVQTARNELGYLEKASNRELEDKTANAGRANYTKYGEWYGINPGAWCAMFISWCADKAGVGTDIFPKHASCSAGVRWFREKGLWRKRGEHVPRAGDVVYFSRDGESPVHVGLVTAYSSGRVYTVEGNTSSSSGLIENGGMTAEKSYSETNERILGYGVPEYPVLEEDEMTQERFNEMAEAYLAGLTKREPSAWSAEARRWAEEQGHVKGDGTGGKQYGKLLTKEEAVQLLYNIFGGEEK